jgi:hypothetical protein
MESSICWTTIDATIYPELPNLLDFRFCANFRGGPGLWAISSVWWWSCRPWTWAGTSIQISLEKKWKRLWCYIICMLYYNMYIIYVCYDYTLYVYVCVLIYFDKSFMAFYTIKIKLRHLLSIYFKGVISYNSSKWLCKPTSKWVKIFKNHRRYKFSTHLIWRPSISVI